MVVLGSTTNLGSYWWLCDCLHLKSRLETRITFHTREVEYAEMEFHEFTSKYIFSLHAPLRMLLRR